MRIEEDREYSPEILREARRLNKVWEESGGWEGARDRDEWWKGYIRRRDEKLKQENIKRKEE